MRKKILFPAVILLFVIMFLPAPAVSADAQAQTVKAVAANPAGVVAHYELDGSVNDSASASAGRENGEPSYKPGCVASDGIGHSRIEC